MATNRSKPLPRCMDNDERYQWSHIRIKNVYDHCKALNHLHRGIESDEDWVPVEGDSFTPTDYMPGSPGKIAVMRKRLLEGQPIHHIDDRMDLSDGEYDKHGVGAMPVSSLGMQWTRAELARQIAAVEEKMSNET